MLTSRGLSTVAAHREVHSAAAVMKQPEETRGTTMSETVWPRE